MTTQTMNNATAPRTVVISDADHQSLAMLIRDYRSHGDESRENLDALERELSRAVRVPPHEVPADVVTMNSTVRLRVSGMRSAATYTIVYPSQADIDEDRISVLAPLATAVLGYRVGDSIDWDLPGGRKQITIEKLVH